MLNKFKNTFNLNDYKKTIGKQSNIHKVSYFFKEDIENLHSKKLLIFDLEFSMNKHIFEIGGFILNKNKIEKTFFKEYSLPYGEPYWSFDTNSFITTPINKNKKAFSKKDADYLLALIDSVDYVIVHNYVAEAQCLAKLRKEMYSASTCPIIQSNKFICTNFSFKNKYFKNKGMTEFTNSSISNYFGWKIKSKDSLYVIKNENIKFSIKKPNGVESILHNSFYDSVITLTNFMSLKKIYL